MVCVGVRGGVIGSFMRSGSSSLFVRWSHFVFVLGEILILKLLLSKSVYSLLYIPEMHFGRFD